ncbi:MAG: dynamin family protein [Bacteroidetes bacterium]|nr:dynamin family protein [Bacteroidota bacterium]
MTAKTLVEIPLSHRNEWKSKRNFEELIDKLGMYMPFGWAIRDYGIDGQVEITRPIKDSDSFAPESKYFLFQLKSIEKLKAIKKHISFSIPVKKVIQWYSSNLPVMFVLNDLITNEFYLKWIDEKLINNLDNTNPNWVNQEFITLKISIYDKFENYSLDLIRDYVLSWKTPAKKIIEAGTYFELKDKCITNLAAYSEICQPFNFDSVNNSLKALNNQIEQSIYRISITGPSRVGKSSLINALLRRKDVSPTGIFQTTGVPIQILPGKADTIKVTFRGGKTTTHKFSKEVVKSFASQIENEDNKKEVTLLEIHLANRQLEHGVSFFDIPGLDDPDENVYNYTWSTVTKSNAILYLIDSSPFENGGYIFKSEYKKHIVELGQSLDKIFLVFTKINALSGDKLSQLQDRVTQDLKKYNLYEKVSGKVFYISAEESLEARLKKKGVDSVQKLENDIWSYLLKENKIGLVNLNYVNKELIGSIKDFEGILHTRLLDNENRKKLVNAINKVKNKIPILSKLYFNTEREIKKSISISLENRKYKLLSELEIKLKSFELDVDLPNKKTLQNYLVHGAHKALQQTNIEYEHQVNLLKAMIDNWITDNLKQVREIISGNSEQKIVDFSAVEKFETPTVDLSTSFGVGLFTGIVGFLINPPGAILSGILGFFGNFVLSASERRAKNISKIMQSAKKCYNVQFKKINSAYLDLVKEHSKLIIDYANKKVNLFISDLQYQMKKLSETISNLEEVEYREAFSKIELLKKSINNLENDINGWIASV